MLYFKRVISWLANSLGYEITRKSIKFNNTLSILDLAVNAVIQPGKRFFFMQIGANDGILYDPLRPIIIRRQLEGLLVEPQPDKFQQLLLNYATQKQLKFENCAVTPENGECTLFRVRPDAAYPSYTQGFASLKKEHLIKNGIREKYIEKLKVPSLTFASLIEKYQIDTISLLQIDTEGFDYEILKMAFDSLCFPRILNFEHFHLPQNDLIACYQKLKSNGYSFVQIGYDTVAIREV